MWVDNRFVIARQIKSRIVNGWSTVLSSPLLVSVDSFVTSDDVVHPEGSILYTLNATESYPCSDTLEFFIPLDEIVGVQQPEGEEE
jgi:hypothetical protein